MKTPAAVATTAIVTLALAIAFMSGAQTKQIPAVFSTTTPLFTSTISLTSTTSLHTNSTTPHPKRVTLTENPIAFDSSDLTKASALADSFVDGKIIPHSPSAATNDINTPPDSYLWLEEVTGEKSLAWVREQNAITANELMTSSEFLATRHALLSIYNDKDKLPDVTYFGGYYYNFWQDDTHPHGLWRRIISTDFRKPEPVWEPVIDIDALCSSEKENWSWNGFLSFGSGDERGLVILSRGGSVANVMREFDLKLKKFVSPEEGGFVVPEARNRVCWNDRDTLFVATDVGPDSITQSGYPRILKEWKRGTPLSEAPTIFEAKKTDMLVRGERFDGRDVIIHELDFFNYDAHIRQNDTWVKLDRPHHVLFGLNRGQIIFHTSADWTICDAQNPTPHTYPARSMLTESLEKYLSGDRSFKTLFTGKEDAPMLAMFFTQNYLVIETLDDLSPRVEIRNLNGNDEAWENITSIISKTATLNIRPAGESGPDDVFITTQDFLTPPTLLRCTLGNSQCEALMREPARFDADGMETHRYEAVSKDGTRVPYFVVTPKNFRADGTTPTILNGYGGFGAVRTPQYYPEIGKAWLERGGAFAFACIRGEGTFGPSWHSQGIREKRQNSFDDFAAIAQDLIARKITVPAHLGITGQSNGGTLVAVEFIQHPELFGAIVSQFPVLDMRRYTKLSVGKRWIPEIGDPDTQRDWLFLKQYSPYQNVKPDTQQKYPRVLFITSTNDDTAHPGHTRKMTALMKAQGHDVLFYENIDGGHLSATTTDQRAVMDALIYTFFANELGLATPPRR